MLAISLSILKRSQIMAILGDSRRLSATPEVLQFIASDARCERCVCARARNLWPDEAPLAVFNGSKQVQMRNLTDFLFVQNRVSLFVLAQSVQNLRFCPLSDSGQHPAYAK